jgi:hypothetical protein
MLISSSQSAFQTPAPHVRSSAVSETPTHSNSSIAEPQSAQLQTGVRRQRGGGRIYETIHYYNNQRRFRALLPNGRFLGALSRREDAELVLEAALRFKLRGVNYKGVDSEGNDLFESYLVQNGEIQHIGYFDTIEDAALAYDRSARRVLGRKADLNYGEDREALLDAPGCDHRYLSLLCSFSRG